MINQFCLRFPNPMSQKKHAITKTEGKLSIKGETDRISELPDDILYSVVSYFTVRDAAIASILSSRWRPLCASMSRLNFDLCSMFRPHEDPFVMFKLNAGTCRSYKDLFVRGVNQFLQFYKGSKLVRIRVSFCLEEDSTYDIDQWVSFAANIGVKALFLNFSCDDCFRFGKTSRNRNLYTLRSELLSKGNMANVKSLILRSCILEIGVINQFCSLKTLYLACVTLPAHEVESILSCCLNLQSMSLSCCELIPILCIPGSLQQLKFLAVISCWGVEEIEVSATNLTRFDFDSGSIKFSFSRAPNLKKIFCRAFNEKMLHYVFRQLAKDLPQVESLLICSEINWVQCLPKQITTFSKVKQLEFYSPKNIKFDFLKIIAILQACPLLEKFHLVMYSLYPEEEIPRLPIPLEYVHKYLKEVHIGGFYFRASYIEFVINMLEYAVALERMVIDPKLEFYDGLCKSRCSRVEWDIGERAKVCSRLQNHSKSSRIIIR